MAKKPAPPKRPSARERLLAASDVLFYRDGVHSTGIDAVIEKAGVAKGSLYYIFGGKDELIAAYLRGRHESWRKQVEELQSTVDDPAEKILAIFDVIGDYAALPEYRGCAFANASAEASAGSAQELATKQFREWPRGSLLDLASETGAVDPEPTRRRAGGTPRRCHGDRDDGRHVEGHGQDREANCPADTCRRQGLEFGVDAQPAGFGSP
jgi:AcrR family transcriptional regulator